MSTLLELCNLAAAECTYPSLGTAQNQTGQRADMVRWVKETWMEVQRAHRNWNWMRDEFSFTTTASQQAYTPRGAAPTGAALTRFRQWHIDTFRCYLTSTADEQWMVFQPYIKFRDRYMFGSVPSSRPMDFSIRPRDKALLFGNIPDQVYTITGEYQKSSLALSADADEPDMPDEFHQIIVYGAMRKYAHAENAPEVEARGLEGWNRMMGELVADQLPPVEFGDPLA